MHRAPCQTTLCPFGCAVENTLVNLLNNRARYRGGTMVYYFAESEEMTHAGDKLVLHGTMANRLATRTEANFRANFNKMLSFSIYATSCALAFMQLRAVSESLRITCNNGSSLVAISWRCELSSCCTASGGWELSVSTRWCVGGCAKWSCHYVLSSHYTPCC